MPNQLNFTFLETNILKPPTSFPYIRYLVSARDDECFGPESDFESCRCKQAFQTLIFRIHPKVVKPAASTIWWSSCPIQIFIKKKTQNLLDIMGSQRGLSKKAQPWDGTHLYSSAPPHSCIVYKARFARHWMYDTCFCSHQQPTKANVSSKHISTSTSINVLHSAIKNI